MAYATGQREEKRCTIGRVWSLDWGAGSVVVHRRAPRMDARLRLKWEPLSESSAAQGGAERAAPKALAQPSLEKVPAAQLLLVVQLHDGVISHASARRLDRAGWRIREGIARTPESVNVHRIREEWLNTLEEMTRRCREVPMIGGMKVSAVVPHRSEGLGVARGFVTEKSGPSIGVHFGAPEDLQKWVKKSRIDFLEVYSGKGSLTSAVKETGLKVGEGLDAKVIAYNRYWDLADKDMVVDFAWLVCVALRPKATHTGTPCTHQCVLGQKDPSAQDQRLYDLSLILAEHQQAHGLLASDENPVGSQLRKQRKWESVFGTMEEPVFPWRVVRGDGCQMGCSCPGWRKETPGEQEAKEGQPVKKARDWLTNFDLSIMARRCKQTAALFSAWHDHVQLRGSVRTPDGLVKLASFSGQYSEVESALYANALRKALGNSTG